MEVAWCGSVCSCWFEKSLDGVALTLQVLVNGNGNCGNRVLVLADTRVSLDLVFAARLLVC